MLKMYKQNFINFYKTSKSLVDCFNEINFVKANIIKQNMTNKPRET
jgi:hypothetical protein